MYREAVKGILLCLGSLMVLAIGHELLAGPDYQDQNTQLDPGQFWLFRTTGSQILPDSFNVRVYIAGADSSDTMNHLDLTGGADCGNCFEIQATTRDGETRRDAVWNFMLVPQDTLVNVARIPGGFADQAGTDSTAIAASSIYTPHVADSSLTGADIATGEIGSPHLANGGVASVDITDGTIVLADWDSTETMVCGELRVARTLYADSVYSLSTGAGINLGDAQGRAEFGATAIDVDTLTGFTGTTITLPDGKLQIGTATGGVPGYLALHDGDDNYVDIHAPDDAQDFVLPTGTVGSMRLIESFGGDTRWVTRIDLTGRAKADTVYADEHFQTDGTNTIGNGDADSTTFAAYMPRTEHHFKVGQDLTVAGAITQHAGGGACTFADIDVLTNIDTATLTATGNIQGVDVTATDDLECTDQCNVGGALRVDGATECDGTVGLGNASSDSVTVTGGTRFVNDVEFDADVSFEDGPANSVLGSDGVWRLLVHGWQVFTDSYAHLSYSDTRIAIPITGCAAGYYSNARVCDVDDSHDYDRVVQSYTKAGTLVVVMDAAVTATGYSISYEAAEPNHP